MKRLNEFQIPGAYKVDHTDGLRDSMVKAGEQCIGKSLREINNCVYFVDGVQFHPDNETELELTFEGGHTFHLTIAHCGEAYVIDCPIFPNKMDDGDEFRRCNLTGKQPWDRLVGHTLRRVEVVLRPCRGGHRIGAFLLYFGEGGVLGFNSDETDGAKFEMNPGWKAPEHEIAVWLSEDESCH